MDPCGEMDPTVRMKTDDTKSEIHGEKRKLESDNSEYVKEAHKKLLYDFQSLTAAGAFELLDKNDSSYTSCFFNIAEAINGGPDERGLLVKRAVELREVPLSVEQRDRLKVNGNHTTSQEPSSCAKKVRIYDEALKIEMVAIKQTYEEWKKSKVRVKFKGFFGIEPGFMPTLERLLPMSNKVNHSHSTQYKDFRILYTSVDTFSITGCFDGLEEEIRSISKNHGSDPDEVEAERWVLPLAAYHDILVFLRTKELSADVMPPETLKYATIAKARKSGKCPSVLQLVALGVPQYLANTLAPFQRRGVEFVVKDNKGRALIADEMGLGKTIQSVAAMTAFRHEWPLLVLCPSNAKFHWKSEFQAWLGPAANANTQGNDADGNASEVNTLANNNIRVLSSGKEDLLPDGSTQVVICSYDLAKNLADQQKLVPGMFKCAIVDESHVLKNGNAKRTKKLLPILCGTSRCVLLSGTPAFATPLEMYPQISIIGTERCWEDEKDFKQKYEGRGKEHKRAELHARLMATNVIRRMKKDILHGLPPKTRELGFIEVMDKVDEDSRNKMTKGMSTLRQGKGTLCEIARELVAEDDVNMESSHNGLSIERSKAALSQMFLLTGKMKIEFVVEMLKLWLNDSTKGKLCIFAHHKFVLNSIVQLAGLSNKSGSMTRYIRIDGSTQPDKRQKQIDMFQKEPSVRIAILGITAAGVAVTLTASSTVWFAELHWTPAIMIQAEDRCHRIGQQAQVRCLYFVARETLDEVLWKLLERKFEALGEFVEGQEKLKIVVNRTYVSNTELVSNLVSQEPSSLKEGTAVDSKFNLMDVDVGDNITHQLHELGRAELQQDAEVTSGESNLEESSRDYEEYALLNKSYPNLRYYKMQFNGSKYGLKFSLIKGRVFVTGVDNPVQVQGVAKPAVGDVVVALNSYAFRANLSKMESAAVKLKAALLDEKSPELLFAEDRAFQTYVMQLQSENANSS